MSSEKASDKWHKAVHVWQMSGTCLSDAWFLTVRQLSVVLWKSDEKKKRNLLKIITRTPLAPVLFLEESDKKKSLILY